MDENCATCKRLKQRILSFENAARQAVRFEKELMESRRMLSTLLSNLPGMAYRCQNDLDWTMAFVSDGCLELTGYSPERLVDSREISFGELIHPDDRMAGWETIQAALLQGQAFQRDYRIIRADHEIRWVWEKGRGVFDRSDQLIALEGFITDITEHKRVLFELEDHRERLEEQVARRTKALQNSNAELQQSENTLKNILAASPVGIGLVENERLRWVNQGLSTLFGFQKPEDCLEMPLWRLWPNEKDYARWRHGLILSNAAVEPYKADVRLRREPDFIFDGHLRISCADRNDPLSQAVMTASDLSWRKEAERDHMEKERLTGVLEMAGAVCHEMNQPLQEIYLDLAEFLENSADRTADLTSFKTKLDRIRAITSKLVRITRYRTRAYIKGQVIIDIDSASQ